MAVNHVSKQHLMILTKKRIQEYIDEPSVYGDYLSITHKDSFPEPFGLVRVTLLWKFLVHGYYHERNRTKNLSTECKHHLARFNDEPKQFVSYIMKGICKLKLTRKVYRSELGDNNIFEAPLPPIVTEIRKLTVRGICKNCAHILAAELIEFC